MDHSPERQQPEEGSGELPQRLDYYTLVHQLLDRCRPRNFLFGLDPDEQASIPSTTRRFLEENRLMTRAHICALLDELQRARQSVEQRQVERETDPYEDALSRFTKRHFGRNTLEAMQGVRRFLQELLSSRRLP